MSEPEALTVAEVPALSCADKSRTDPSEDEFGYAPFAKRLANSIVRMTPQDGFVMAVYGPWGAGKTTLLNFIQFYINQEDEAVRPVVFSFNPWWFSGHEDLAKTFFAQLTARVSGDNRFKNLREKLASFSEAIADAPIPYAGAGKTIAKLVRPPVRGVPELKAQVGEELQKRGIKILVVIDDIDRLTAEETRQLFRVIKAVADFPNTVYLLAFDQVAAVKAIEQTQGVGLGASYLEKIIQAPYELPVPGRTVLDRLFVRQVDAIIAGPPPGLFDMSRWADLFMDGVRLLIKTPRHLVRFTNSLRITYPAARGEVNVADFIAIEALRVFLPEAWHVIRNNPEMFAGPNTSSKYSDEKEQLKAFHEAWLPSLKTDEKVVRSIVEELFPKVHSVRGNVFFDHVSEREWRVSRRISSPSVFPIYFGTALPDGDLSNAEMQALLSQAGDAEAFGRRLLELDKEVGEGGVTRAEHALVRLQDYTDQEIDVKSIPSIFAVLFDIGDILTTGDEKKRRGAWIELGTDVQIGRIVYQLSQRMDQTSRFELFRNIFAHGKALVTIAHRMVVFSQENGKYGGSGDKPEEMRSVNLGQLYTLEQITARRISEAASKGELPKDHRALRLLRFWHDWGDPTDVRRFASALIETDAGLLKTLDDACGHSRVQSAGSRVWEETPYLDPESLRPIFDPDELVERVRCLLSAGGLTERQRTVAEMFMAGYEMRKSGRDPSSPLGL